MNVGMAMHDRPTDCSGYEFGYGHGNPIGTPYPNSILEDPSRPPSLPLKIRSQLGKHQLIGTRILGTHLQHPTIRHGTIPPDCPVRCASIETEQMCVISL
jgi:hypothetical protein